MGPERRPLKFMVLLVRNAFVVQHSYVMRWLCPVLSFLDFHKSNSNTGGAIHHCPKLAVQDEIRNLGHSQDIVAGHHAAHPTLSSIVARSVHRDMIFTSVIQQSAEYLLATYRFQTNNNRRLVGSEKGDWTKKSREERSASRPTKMEMNLNRL